MIKRLLRDPLRIIYVPEQVHACTHSYSIQLSRHPYGLESVRGTPILRRSIGGLTWLHVG